MAAHLLAKVKTIPGVVDADTSLNDGKPELSVRIDRAKAADLGVQLSDAAEALRLLVGGDAVTTYNEAASSTRCMCAPKPPIAPPMRRSARLPVPSTRLGAVTLDNVATLLARRGAVGHPRLSRQRQVTVSANLLPGTSQATVQNADHRGRGGDRPAGGLPRPASADSRAS